MNTITISRNNYATYYQYLKDFRTLKKSYDFRARIESGWIFFRFLNDYLIWKNQK